MQLFDAHRTVGPEQERCRVDDERIAFLVRPTHRERTLESAFTLRPGQRGSHELAFGFLARRMELENRLRIRLRLAREISARRRRRGRRVLKIERAVLYFLSTIAFRTEIILVFFFV